MLIPLVGLLTTTYNVRVDNFVLHTLVLFVVFVFLVVLLFTVIIRISSECRLTFVLLPAVRAEVGDICDVAIRQNSLHT